MTRPAILVPASTNHRLVAPRPRRRGRDSCCRRALLALLRRTGKCLLVGLTGKERPTESRAAIRHGELGGVLGHLVVLCCGGGDMAGGCCLAGCYLYSYLIVRGSLVKLASGVANGEVIGVGTGGATGGFRDLMNRLLPRLLGTWQESCHIARWCLVNCFGVE